MGLSLRQEAESGLTNHPFSNRGGSMGDQITNTLCKTLFGAILFVGVNFTTIAQAQEATSQLVRQLYDGGWPDKDTVTQLNKERLYQRGIEAYMMTLPALNVIGMRDASEAKFGKGYNVRRIA
jgi:hypothetical protein